MNRELWPWNDDRELLKYGLGRDTYYFWKSNRCSHDSTWLGVPHHWVSGKEDGAGPGLGALPAAPHLLTEDDWAGACADTLLPGVLPCLLATRLAWKGQFLSLESQISLSPTQALTFQGRKTGWEGAKPPFCLICVTLSECLRFLFHNVGIISACLVGLLKGLSKAKHLQ